MGVRGGKVGVEDAVALNVGVRDKEVGVIVGVAVAISGLDGVNLEPQARLRATDDARMSKKSRVDLFLKLFKGASKITSGQPKPAGPSLSAPPSTWRIVVYMPGLK